MAGAREAPRWSRQPAVNTRMSSSEKRNPRSRAILLEKMSDGHDPQVIVFQLVLLVRSVQAVVGEAEAHQNGWNAEVRGEVAHDRNRPAGADEYSGPAEYVAESLRRNLNGGLFGIHHQAGGSAQHADFGLNAAGRILADPIAKRGNDLLGFLPRDQAEADFGGGLGRNHGLRARTCETARDAVHLEGRARPHAFEYGAVWL